MSRLVSFSVKWCIMADLTNDFGVWDQYGFPGSLKLGDSQGIEYGKTLAWSGGSAGQMVKSHILHVSQRSTSEAEAR